MFPKRDRLKKHEAFQEVFRRGKPFFFGGIGCRILTGQEQTRIGLTVTKKAYPRAVDRNRAKRLFAEAVRANRKDIPSDTHIVFFLGKPLETLSLDVFDRAISMIFRNMR